MRCVDEPGLPGRSWGVDHTRPQSFAFKTPFVLCLFLLNLSATVPDNRSTFD